MLNGMPQSRERLGIIGFGPIGMRLAERFSGSADGPHLAALLVRQRDIEMATKIAPDAIICTDIQPFLEARLDVAVECASAETLKHDGPQLLAAGCDIIPLSLGAFADVQTEALLFAAASRGAGRIEIPAGALGSIGFLAAARENGLTGVTVTVGYPTERWRAMKAGHLVDLNDLQSTFTFLEASAREVARLFPGHLNVVTGAALAGLGLDRTTVALVADPTATQAWFHIEALSDSGPVSLHVGGRNAPVDHDPIDYTTFSVIRLLRRRSAPLAI
ncbi:aspartate dehydrogenase domain-containing protein [Rhizobium sp. 0TCS1.26]|uniref:aspartate dehydrogenase domain-containing protein n=1 Tax=Rhizobium sp. 0TCS1.26 TaxID=3142623 RepID=UPI003D2A6010